MATVASCTITDETITHAWRGWTQDDASAPTPEVLRQLRERASMIEGAMEDAGLGLVRVLIMDILSP